MSRIHQFFRLSWILFAILVWAMLSGCGTLIFPHIKRYPESPLRKVIVMDAMTNDTLDDATIRFALSDYVNWMPPPARSGIDYDIDPRIFDDEIEIWEAEYDKGGFYRLPSKVKFGYYQVWFPIGLAWGGVACHTYDGVLHISAPGHESIWFNNTLASLPKPVTRNIAERESEKSNSVSIQKDHIVISLCPQNTTERMKRHQQALDRALIEAVVTDKLRVTKHLIEAGANVNTDGDRGDMGSTPLMHAAASGLIEIMQVLFEHGADSNAKNQYGDTALIKAASQGQIEAIELLLAYGADINIVVTDAYTALTRAASHSHLDAVEFLVKHRANINAHVPKGQTALMHAAYNGDVPMLKFLLEHGADVNATVQDGFTALMSASSENHINIAQILMRNGADVSIQWKGSTALDMARTSEMRQILQGEQQ